MANSEFTGVACGDDWTEATTIRDVFLSGGGAFEIEAQPAKYRLQYSQGYAQGKSEQGDGSWTVEKDIGTGGGTISPGVTGIQFKNKAPGQIAIVSARLHKRDEPFLALTFANPVINIPNQIVQVIAELDLSVGFNFNGIPATFKHLRIEGIARCAAAGVDQGMNLNFNSDAGANYDEDLIIGQNSAPGAFSAINTAAPLCGQITGAGSPAGAFGAFVIDIPYYSLTTNRKSYIAKSHSPTGAVASMISGTYGGVWKNLAAINQITLGAGGTAFVAGSFATLYGIN